ncbi:anaerobic glycerol-3-phosphate dehydrogenase subunit C [Thalassoglobus polymorphus]|uniref:Anaerobic glycerol-3-phosphate dehydrogenase subunit C n=1 Tax=Thalassoglobus polymorphus TaxID=2527994 RepID=A0A517QRR7_9PLAN|nr:anaerobic glycerol-3-phosphate dehydrogenase subunit C [Thalassoglobus polymorphus]QDT34323.1 Anaerobic glycerol-3-phosphate dehydrogenase subunit C [Thalassoglobus polymorphus]
MDEQQLRILDDLKGEFAGELHFDAISRELFSSDGSLYQILPLGVAFPKSAEDVSKLAAYTYENDIPLIPRGSGTGVAGGCLGRGIVVDFSRHMKNILHVDGSTVRVQAGVVRDQLNRHLRQHDRYFPPDPSNTAMTTVGGMIAVDAAGSHAIRVGSTRDYVQSVETVLADGFKFEAQRVADALSIPKPGRETDLVHQLAMLLNENAELIRQHQPSLVRNCSGYQLRGVMDGRAIHVPRLLVGSEGSLGIFTEATLHTSPIPSRRGAVLLLFGDLEKAIDAIEVMTGLQPSACDLLDRRLLSLAREADPRFAKLIPVQAEAGVLIEQTGYSNRQVEDRLQNIIHVARNADSTVHVGMEAFDEEGVEFLWSLPYRVIPLLSNLRGETRPLPFVEDIAVPPESLHQFLIKAQKVFQKHWVTASLYAHAASGQVHFRPFLAIPNSDNASRIEEISRDLYEVAFEFGGTVSGEHGNGLARTAFIRSQYGPLYRVFQKVKELFDPHNLLNPNKIISDDPHLTIRDFRVNPDPEQTRSELIPLQLQWKEGELEEETLRCNGCGNCRVQFDSSYRMCPFFHEETSEVYAPRSKANLIRALATSSIDSKAFSTEQAKELADSCFNCKQCQLECPSKVNIPALAIEAKAQFVAASGLPRSDWFLSRAHSFGKLGVAISPLANWLLGNRISRWMVEKLFGISQYRRLPKFAHRRFLNTWQAGRYREDRKKKQAYEVVYFVDHYANFHDPELGDAFLRVLEHNNIGVVIPRHQVASGMAMISAGDLEAARELAEINLGILGEFAREGKTIVCTEPTAAVCLKQEYPRLIDHPDTQVVADQTVDAGAYFQSLHSQGRLLTDFHPLEKTLGYHTPCHTKALNESPPWVELLKCIPDLNVQSIDKGCSGMAGAFGMSAKNFELSLKMGAGLIAEMQRPDLMLGASECSSCQFQMKQNSALPTLHPLKILALAYGIMPSIQRKLTPDHRERTLIT